MPLHVPGDQVHEEVAAMGTTSFKTKAVYGNSASLMIATRPAGYHSRPHRHACEQLNLLRAGEVWVFIEERAFLLKAGDFLRIPAGAVHWAWNKSGAPCEMVEVHSPGLQHDPTVSEFAVGLFDEQETPEPQGTPVNELLPADAGFDPAVVEKQAE